MTALFVTLGIAVLALLALLLWFVPHLLHQQAARVSGETAQLREMLLDLLNEQESVAVRQNQFSATLSGMQSRLETIARSAHDLPATGTAVDSEAVQQLERRLGDMQDQLQRWLDERRSDTRTVAQGDNESWAHLLSLISVIQERVGTLSRDRATALAALQAGQLLDELEREMLHLRGISDDIAVLQQRLRRSLNDREALQPLQRTRPTASASALR